ncbi:hypothetical protein PENTCL1PPCAC_15819, partial [Pristionchus entomophagus]
PPHFSPCASHHYINRPHHPHFTSNHEGSHRSCCARRSLAGHRLPQVHLQQGVGLQAHRLQHGRRLALLWILSDQVALLPGLRRARKEGRRFSRHCLEEMRRRLQLLHWMRPGLRQPLQEQVPQQGILRTDEQTAQWRTERLQCLRYPGILELHQVLLRMLVNTVLYCPYCMINSHYHQ